MTNPKSLSSLLEISEINLYLIISSPVLSTAASYLPGLLSFLSPCYLMIWIASAYSIINILLYGNFEVGTTAYWKVNGNTGTYLTPCLKIWAFLLALKKIIFLLSLNGRWNFYSRHQNYCFILSGQGWLWVSLRVRMYWWR